jgi:hypothetical protein
MGSSDEFTKTTAPRTACATCGTPETTTFRRLLELPPLIGSGDGWVEHIRLTQKNKSGHLAAGQRGSAALSTRSPVGGLRTSSVGRLWRSLMGDVETDRELLVVYKFSQRMSSACQSVAASRG